MASKRRRRSPRERALESVTGKLKRRRGIATDEFTFVRALTARTVKVTLPSPCSQHLKIDVFFLEYDSLPLTRKRSCSWW